MNGHIEVSSNC